jgi:hypothetical protein
VSAQDRLLVRGDEQQSEADTERHRNERSGPREAEYNRGQDPRQPNQGNSFCCHAPTVTAEDGGRMNEGRASTEYWLDG